MLNAAQIEQADDLPTEVVTVPEWGGDVTVGTMTSGQRDAWELATSKLDADARHIRATLVAACLRNEDGAVMFSDPDTAATMLAGKSASAMERVFTVAARMNRVLTGDVEELAKNSSTVQGDGSDTDSPSPSDGPSASSTAS